MGLAATSETRESDALWQPPTASPSEGCKRPDTPPPRAAARTARASSESHPRQRRRTKQPARRRPPLSCEAAIDDRTDQAPRCRAGRNEAGRALNAGRRIRDGAGGPGGRRPPVLPLSKTLTGSRTQRAVATEGGPAEKAPTVAADRGETATPDRPDVEHLPD